MTNPPAPFRGCVKSTNCHPERSRGATIQPDLRRLLRGESARKDFSHSLAQAGIEPRCVATIISGISTDSVIEIKELFFYFTPARMY